MRTAVKILSIVAAAACAVGVSACEDEVVQAGGRLDRRRAPRPTRPSTRHGPANVDSGQVKLDREARQSRGTPPTTSPESLT